ncbi:Peptidase family S41 [Pedobacter caeni]|uniref:Peptidase family S41 n=1 Tax=Pedobacter caeni TaxID=288992 RepID=A0A1M5BTL9_9SPHI|nr:Peptidase family S41 [Pedobacter caeni]
MIFPCITYAQKKSFHPAATISADSAKKSIVELLDELGKKHPGFYRYTDKASFNHYIDSSLATIQGPQDQLSFYHKLKPLIARIRCMHTGLSLSENYRNYLDKTANMLPLDLFFIGERAYITGNYSGNPDLSLGTEVLSINGKTTAEIKKIMFENISSDGFNETLKYQMINNRFAGSYRSIVEVNHQFKVVLASGSGKKDLILNAVRNEAIPVPEVMDLKNKPRLDLTYNEDAAILRIHSFGETDIKEGRQNFKKFIRKAFEELQNKQIKNLVIDLRNNTGGTDVNAAYLCSYLMNKPYRYWDRIEVTEPFALSIKGSAKMVYGKPIKKDSVYLWQKSRLSSEFDFFEPQQPQANPYQGKVYVLINGTCLSSCADLAAVLQYNKRATFIGEETGGAYQGNNSGLIPDTKVSFDINVNVPLLKYINAVDQTKNYGHGTYPDLPYARTINDILEKKDPEMEIALKTIREK